MSENNSNRFSDAIKQFSAGFGESVNDRRTKNQHSEESLAKLLNDLGVPVSIDNLKSIESGDLVDWAEGGMRLLLALVFLYDLPVSSIASQAFADFVSNHDTNETADKKEKNDSDISTDEEFIFFKQWLEKYNEEDSLVEDHDFETMLTYFKLDSPSNNEEHNKVRFEFICTLLMTCELDEEKIERLIPIVRTRFYNSGFSIEKARVISLGLMEYFNVKKFIPDALVSISDSSQDVRLATKRFLRAVNYIE